MRISDWSSDVCSSDLRDLVEALGAQARTLDRGRHLLLLRVLGAGGVAADLLHLDSRARELIDPAVAHVGRLRRLSGRAEERRVRKERVSTCRSRWSPYH